ncbi:hypothetical protein C0708_22500 [Aeromonas caviae]|nr:hypothetical protein C0708_22500 [Aeromonas caviae]
MPEREVPVSGSPSEVKVTAQVTDQAGKPVRIADDTAKVDTWRPDAERGTARRRCRRHLQQGRDW